MNEVSLRRARPDDADAIADVFLASFAATYQFRLAHSDDEVRQWIPEVLLPTEEVWVATGPDEAVLAMMALSSDMVGQLYVAPGWTGRGIGSRLIELAKSRRPGGLDLYTFQVNAGARRFYERHGFVEVWRGDGSDNEEGQPDLRYAWRPSSQPTAAGRNGGDELTAETQFDAIVEPFSGDPRVTRGTGFGSSPGRRIDGRIFAMLVRGELVVKLPRQRVGELVEAGSARRFDAGKGRPMREWASISVAQADAWPELVAEAYEFVGAIGRPGGA